MTLTDLLAMMERRHVRLWTEDATLRYDAPQGTMTALLLKALRDNKDRLVACLQGKGEPEAQIQFSSFPKPLANWKTGESYTPRVFRGREGESALSLSHPDGSGGAKRIANGGIHPLPRCQD